VFVKCYLLGLSDAAVASLTEAHKRQYLAQKVMESVEKKYGIVHKARSLQFPPLPCLLTL
jgi:hypothetical protein